MIKDSKKKNIPSKDNPKFGIIAPIEYLYDYSIQSHFHLVLAHLLDTNQSYTNFYKNMSKNGDFIICDNGAFELGESYDPDKLIKLASRCDADAIVLPDYPFKHSSVTIKAAEDMIKEIKDAGFYTMFVPQSKVGDLEDWIKCYEWAANSEDIDIIGMSILGIPNALNKVHIAYARVVMTQILIERGLFNFDKYHHYLGLNSGVALEIPTLINLRALDSCDSSGPVWAGICGHRYTPDTDSFQTVSKIKKHVDFNYPSVKDEQTHDRIQHNIDMTLSIFK